MSLPPAHSHSHKASDVVSEALCTVFCHEKTPSDSIFVENENRAGTAFAIVERGLATKGNGECIYARVMVDGRWTWRTSETDDIDLARKWKEDWDRKRWLEKQGFVVKEGLGKTTEKPDAEKSSAPDSTEKEKKTEALSLTVDQILDNYVAAGHPTIKKRKLKPKSPRSIYNEEFALVPLRSFFGKKLAAQLTLGDCDAFHCGRKKGGYIAKFSLRGRPTERRTKGGDRAVDLNLVVLSNALELAVRQGHLKVNPIRDRGQYSDDAIVRHCREVAPTPHGLVLIVDWLETNP